MQYIQDINMGKELAWELFKLTLATLVPGNLESCYFALLLLSTIHK